MNQPSSPPSVGLVAGKYQLVTMIGRGGMGSVWEARHASLGTRFAIKFIESEYSDSQEARKRFDNEAKAAATIQSKHAIKIFDHGVTDDGKPYIVMELLQGQPLDKKIEIEGRISLQETAEILQQVCRGLARAHEHGIVHRDLKPENVFLVMDPEDGSRIAKVLDFGIAKLSNAPGQPGLTSSTKTGAVLGTPFYMSPEQARGLRNVDHRTDIWSLGIIAYKCVTGKLPFDGESVGDLLVKICTSPVPIPSHAIPGLPPEFDAWFMRALEREPERRYTSVTELADALGRAAGLAPRNSAQSNPNSFVHGATAAVQSGAITPQGLGPPAMLPTPAPMQSPFGSHGSQGGYGQQQNAQSYGARTPNPAGMTNSPFTSSQPIAGVPSSGGKGKLVGIAVGMLAMGGLIAFAAIKQPWKAHKDEGAGLTPSASTALAAPPPANSTLPPVDTGTSAAGAGTIAVNAVPLASAPPAATVAKGTVRGGTTPKTTTTTHTTTTVTTASTTAATTAAATSTGTAKKPPSGKHPDDPGY